MAITEGEWQTFEGQPNRVVAVTQVTSSSVAHKALPATLDDAKLMAAAPELARALRQLHDCAVVDTHYRLEEESRAAFARAAELLQRVGF